jgi:hypothetical protein
MFLLAINMNTRASAARERAGESEGQSPSEI